MQKKQGNNTTPKSDGYKEYNRSKKTIKDSTEKLNNPIVSHTNDYFRSSIIDIDKDSSIINRFWADNRQRYKTDTEMFYRILEYFEKNAQTKHMSKDKKGLDVEKKEPLTWPAMCLDIGMTTSSIKAYATGEYDTEDIMFSSLLAWARDVIENDVQTQSMLGAYNERIAMLTLQSKYNWTVESKLTVDQNVNMSAEQAVGELFSLLQEAKGLLPSSE